MDKDQRNIKLRLLWFKYERKNNNVAKTCRHFGISRHTYYLWLNRYKNKGIKGLNNQSKRPKTMPRATKLEIINEILRLRRRYKIGPFKIGKWLIDKKNIKISSKTIYLILKKFNKNKLY